MSASVLAINRDRGASCCVAETDMGRPCLVLTVWDEAAGRAMLVRLACVDAIQLGNALCVAAQRLRDKEQEWKELQNAT